MLVNRAIVAPPKLWKTNPTSQGLAWKMLFGSEDPGCGLPPNPSRLAGVTPPERVAQKVKLPLLGAKRRFRMGVAGWRFAEKH